jgi:hypothetical protein
MSQRRFPSTRPLLAIAILFALPAFAPHAASAASVGMCFGLFCPFDDPFDERSNTNFDLGIDVSNVPLDRQGVAQFMATLSPEGQHIMLTTCQNYLHDPRQVQSYRTIQFCHVLLGA